jgi:hypothetical protein
VCACYLECAVSRSAMILSDKKQLNYLRLTIPLTTIWRFSLSFFVKIWTFFQLSQKLQCQDEEAMRTGTANYSQRSH